MKALHTDSIFILLISILVLFYLKSSNLQITVVYYSIENAKIILNAFYYRVQENVHNSTICAKND